MNMPENPLMQTGTHAGGLSPVRYEKSTLTDEDLYLFNEGSHYRLYQKLGAHAGKLDG